MSSHENKMIAIKPVGEMDPAMRLALKNHIIRKRQQSKQELEQDAIEKRLKREKEAKRKQDAMTLDQLKEQLSHLEKKIDNLKNEKHFLFAQLKQTVPCEPPRKKMNTNQQPATMATPNANNTNNINSQPTAPSSPSSTPANIAQQHQHQHSQPLQQQQNLAQNPIRVKQNSSPKTPPINQHGQLPLPAPPSSIHNPTHPASNVSPQQTLSSSPPPPQPPPPGPPGRQPSPFASHSQPPQSTPIQLAPHMTNPYLYPGLPPNLGPQPTSAAAAASMQANLIANQQNLMRTPPPQNLNSMFNQAAFSHILNAHNFRGQSPHLAQLSHQQRPSNPYNSPMGPYSQLGHPAQSSLISGHGIPTSMAHAHRSSPLHVRPSPPPSMSSNNPTPVSSASGGSGLNKMPPLTMPPIPTSGGSINFNNSNLSNNTSNSDEPPRKKVHTGGQSQPPPQPLQHQQAPCPPSFHNQLSVGGLPNPYLYAGLPPGLGGAVSAANGAASLQQNLLASQNLMRTPPPNINALINSAAFSQILNAHNFRGQSPYLAQLAAQQHQTRPPHSYSSPMSPFGHVQLGAAGHPGGPSSLMAGHGIPTSLSHSMPQSIPMMRPSPPPQIPGNVTPLNSGSGGHRMPPLGSMQSMPVTSSGQLDFSNPNLMQHYRQAAAAAALGIPFMPPYFNSNNFL